MLNLNLREGDYITIGDNIVVQIFPYGSQTQVLIDAPREIPILRGKLHEQDGGERPDAVINGARKRPKSPSDQRHAAKRLEKLAARQERKEAAQGALAKLRLAVDGMEDTPERDELRRQLELVAALTE